MYLYMIVIFICFMLINFVLCLISFLDIILYLKCIESSDVLIKLLFIKFILKE